MFRKRKKEPVYLPVYADDAKPQRPKERRRITAFLPLLFTAAAVAYSIYSGQKAEEWKHMEFVVAQFKEFKQRPSVIFMNKVLDYEARNFTLPDSPFLLVKQEWVADALSNDRIEWPEKDIKMQVRDLAVDYLTQLGQFYRYYEAGMMSYEDIDANLSYYLTKTFSNLKSQEITIDENDPNLDSLLEVDKRNKLPRSFSKFIVGYGYKDVEDLFCLFHFNIANGDTCRCQDKSRYYKDSIQHRSWLERTSDAITRDEADCL